MVFGLSVKNALKQKWSLVRLDMPPSPPIEGQFQAEEYEEEVSTVWAQIPVPRRSAPLLQWVRGEQQTVTFRATLWAEFLLKDIADDLEALKEATRRDDRLGRPPRYQFTWGRITFECIVMSIGGVRYVDMWADGRIKGVTCEIALIQAPEPLSIVSADSTAPVPSTRYRPVTDGDTYESLALREYGDPDLGIYLRQDATVAFPVAGSVVPMPSSQRFSRRRRVPLSYVLGSSAEAKAARRALIDRRSATVRLPFVRSI